MQDSDNNINQEQVKGQTFSREVVKAFASLFRGRTDCRGKLSTPSGLCIYETITLEHYRKHLRGETSLGVYFNLDDSTCHSAAIDIDDFSFDKAKAVRSALRAIGIPSYIASSKRNHFHVYLFAEDCFISRDIRRILIHVRDELGIKTDKGSTFEVFPKQDYHQPDSPPSEKYPNGRKYPGSYINLPCFGYTRPFLAADDKGFPHEIPLEAALKQIKRTPNEVIEEVLKTLPEEPPEREKKPKGEYKEQGKKFNELAVEKLLTNCYFMAYCADHATTLSEPEWFSECDIFSFFGEAGRQKAHELSAPYPKYTEEETNKKLEYAKEATDRSIGPHTCVHIEKDLGFACPKNCKAKEWNLKSPVVLASRLARAAGLPFIYVSDRFLREKTADTIAAVEQANKPPKIFERSGSIVRIAHDEFGAPYIETLTESACRGFLERAACYVRLTDKGKMVPLPAPPLDIVRDYMSLPNRNLPALLNVTEIPVLRSDGSIVTEPGYDETSRLYYEPAEGLTVPAVADKPSPTELEAAAAFIQEPLTDFPFDSEASKTNALAVLITPVYRPMVAGLVPLCLLDKPQAGTGAGLLSDVIAVIATGRQAAMMAPPRTDEECEKRLGSILLQGQTIITIDNVEGYLYFASLAMLLTTQYFITRILGQSKMVRLPNRGTYIVTGNNVRLGGDMARRCYLSRMDAREARPWMRDPKSFKYQRLIQWVKENRGELLAAILTMARAWITAGKPIPEGLPPLGGFEDWTDTIGGILAHAGFSSFLGNLEFMYQQADVETPQWEGFLAAWQEKFGKEAVITDQVATSIKEHDILADALPDRIDRDPSKITRSLGSALRRRAGVRYPNGLMVIKSEKLVHNAVAWQVVNYQEEAEKGGVRGVSTPKLVSYESDTKGESGELASHLRRKRTNKKEEKEIYENRLEHNSPNSLLATGQIQKPNSPFSDDLWAGMPDFPHDRCPTCGGTDFWPDFESKRFVCGRCHPQPPQIDMEV